MKNRLMACIWWLVRLKPCCRYCQALRRRNADNDIVLKIERFPEWNPVDAGNAKAFRCEHEVEFDTTNSHGVLIDRFNKVNWCWEYTPYSELAWGKSFLRPVKVYSSIGLAVVAGFAAAAFAAILK